MITLAKIASEAGVSRTAVSYVLNGRPNRLRQDTRDRILKLARRHDYQPNALVRALQTKRTHVIGVLLNMLNESITFFGEIIAAVEAAAGERGYHILLGQVNAPHARTEEKIRFLRQMRVDGVMICPDPAAAAFYVGLKKSGLPLVFVDNRIPDTAIPCVHSNDVFGAKLAVRHLISLGHRRIATFAAQEGIANYPVIDRVRGYREALSEAGLSIDPALLMAADEMTPSGVRQALHAVLARTPFTALFAPTDTVAIRAIEALRDAGKRVPEDVAVMGYANMREGAHVTPQLSSVDQKTGEIGRLAATVLIDMIEHPTRKPRIENVTTPELVIRESCGALIRRGTTDDGRRTDKRRTGEEDDSVSGVALAKTGQQNGKRRTGRR